MLTEMEGTTSSMILPTRILVQKDGSSDGIECSAHTMPKPLQREFRHVFGDSICFPIATDSSLAPLWSVDNNLQDKCEILAIPTNQKAREDLVAVGEHIEREKDRLLHVFISFGAEFCQKIRDKGYWADYIDPCSGLPMITTDCNKVYSEVDGMECLLNYKAYNAGFCKILTHPQWGSAVYPATIFAFCPRQLVFDILQEYPSCPQQ